jgi:hypothetical protein
MIDSLEVRVLFLRDGREGLANGKGVVARHGLKEAWSKTAVVVSGDRNEQVARPGIRRSLGDGKGPRLPAARVLSRRFILTFCTLSQHMRIVIRRHEKKDAGLNNQRIEITHALSRKKTHHMGNGHGAVDGAGRRRGG